MEKILGIDLGTNNIGWAIRDTSVKDNQIVDKGVLTFEKGVALNKDVEEPKVKKRTESRGKRRNYQAEKYRKWSLLKYLIKKNMCPLTEEELRLWSVGDFQIINGKKKNIGRKYPQSDKFIQWLQFDFDGDGKPDYERFGFSKHENCYLFRMLAASERPDHKNLFKDTPQLLGRIFYQLVQRRGFKGRDEKEAKTMLEGSEKAGTAGRNVIADKIAKYHTLGAALYQINKEGERIRKRYNLRADFEAELKEICRVQQISNDEYHHLWKAIVWQRPLRSQKGSIGVCTFETNKRRCPISHPLYEEFRTWIFINNLKIDIPDMDSRNRLEFIRNEIYPLFNKKAEDFKLSEIAKILDKVNGKISAKFKCGEKDAKGKYKKDAPDTKVIANKLMYRFNEILGVDWKEKYSWKEILENAEKIVPFSYEDIWHVLFTFDSKEKLVDFSKTKLKLNDDKSEKFSKINLQSGYATLSLSAIKKILPYLQRGFLYNEAIYMANMHKVLGATKLSPEFIDNFTEDFQSIRRSYDKKRIIISTINALINRHINNEFRYGIEDGRTLDEAEKKEVLDGLIDTLGIKKWNALSEKERLEYTGIAENYFLEFLKKNIRSTKDKLFYKIDRLHDAVFNWLQQFYQLPDENKKHLWHPSEQETYPNAKEHRKYVLDGKEYYIPFDKTRAFEYKHPNAIYEGVDIRLLGEPQPVSRGFKNPMALKTLHKLKLLINYLLKTGKIDTDTRVVIEIARELNDANRRKAIEAWQRIREKENEEFAKAIIGTAKIKYPDLDENDPSVINKFRLWFDQIENGQEVMKQVKALKDDVTKLRLWNEQKGQCLYTGKMISITELFDGSKFDVEHTVPASISFDNELKNLTIADTTYNRQIKGNKLPTECPNYELEIRPRLKWMEEKVRGLEKLYLDWQKKTSDTKEVKDEIIQRRHLIKFHLDYWRYKYQTFTCTEYKSGWKNSQLRDTQIITKYALPYLKTIFKKTEVQKGEVTAAFREIYQIAPRLEKKDRSKYSHNAIDAATLTLIPPAVIRDEILLRYNEEKDKNMANVYHEPVRNWKNYTSSYILSIEDDILINHLPEHRTLQQTKKFIRKRGKIQYVRYKDSNGKWHYKLDENGRKIPLIATGDTIRGNLHDESCFAAVKQPQYKQVNNKNVPETDGKGNFIFVENPKRDDNLFFVMRPIKNFGYFGSPDDLDFIVEPNLRQYIKDEIKRRMDSGMSFSEALLQPIWAFGKKNDKNSNPIRPIRNVRCYIKAGGGLVTNPASIRSFKSYQSSHIYKQYYYATNGEIPICAFYELIDNDKIERELRSYPILEVAKNYKLNGIEGIVEANIKKGDKLLIPLKAILKPGQKVFFYKDSIHELKFFLEKQQLAELSKRFYTFINPDDSRLIFIHHLCALSNDEIAKQMEKRGAKKGASSLDFDNPYLKLRLSKAALNMAIEGYDFETLPSGEIKWCL